LQYSSADADARAIAHGDLLLSVLIARQTREAANLPLNYYIL
jgi:hypothetical protein